MTTTSKARPLPGKLQEYVDTYAGARINLARAEHLFTSGQGQGQNVEQFRIQAERSQAALSRYFHRYYQAR